MSETGNSNRAVLPEAVVPLRSQKSGEMREFISGMRKQNPSLARQGGARVQRLLSEAAGKQRGISLVELIMFIVIVSVALAGILLVMNVTTKGSADPLLHKQALAAAESLLEEIELQDFVSASGLTNAVTQANRASEYHIVADYNGFATTGIFPVSGVAAVAGLENYNASVSVADTALGGIAAGSAVLVTVTVTDPQGTPVAISGYRTAY